MRIKLDFVEGRCSKCNRERYVTTNANLCRSCHTARYSSPWLSRVSINKARYSYRCKRTYVKALRTFLRDFRVRNFLFADLPEHFRHLGYFRSAVNDERLVKVSIAYPNGTEPISVWSLPFIRSR